MIITTMGNCQVPLVNLAHLPLVYLVLTAIQQSCQGWYTAALKVETFAALYSPITKRTHGGGPVSVHAHKYALDGTSIDDDWSLGRVNFEKHCLNRETYSRFFSQNPQHVSTSIQRVRRRTFMRLKTSMLTDWEPNKGESEEVSTNPIPSTGISVSDEIENNPHRRDGNDPFNTDVVPVLGYYPAVAQLVTTTAIHGTFEPIRYLIPLPSSSTRDSDSSDFNNQAVTDDIVEYVMVDVPPYSLELVARMQAFMEQQPATQIHNQVAGKKNRRANLVAILITNRDGIHYAEAPAVYTQRYADLKFWKMAFPNLAVVAYRLDIPRDCQPFITQRLDGYGPFALHNETSTTSDSINSNSSAVVNDPRFQFIETGRPLTYQAWDHQVTENVLKKGQPPPDDDPETDSIVTVDVASSAQPYTAEQIRQREEGKWILAIYTPGHTFGSVSYVFPHLRMCCSGYTIPVEDTRIEGSQGRSTGPVLDCRGYITTSRAGIRRQMESARHLVNRYIDRFDTILPSRSSPMVVEGDTISERKEFLLGILDQYQRIGELYEQLGITTGDGNESD